MVRFCGGPFWAADCDVSEYPQMAERGRETSLGVSLYKSTDLIHEGPTHDLITRKSPTSCTITLGVRISTYLGDVNI